MSGKTKIAAGLVDAKGRLEGTAMASTHLGNDGGDIFNQCYELVEKLVAKNRASIIGLGICTVGMVDPVKGIIRKSSVPALNGAHIQRLFEDRFKVPVCVENDLNAPGYGEYLYGAGEGSKLFVYMTLSTGAGISIIYNGKIWRGAHNVAGFVGPVRGLRDGSSLESMFSGRGIAARAGDAFRRKVDTEEVFRLASKGSKPATRIIGDAVYHAALVVASIQVMIDPDMIVIGGSLGVNQPGFIGKIKVLAEKMLGPMMVMLPDGVNISVSQLGSYNGVIGAVALLRDRPNGKVRP